MKTSIGPLLLPLSPSGEAPLHRQIYDALRESILSRRLARGARLPSTRALAGQTDVSRNTVMSAYQQLLAEGYIHGRIGSGSYVCEELPDEAIPAARISRLSGYARQKPRLSKLGESLSAATVIPRRPHQPVCVFRPGPPATDEFPWKIWSRISARRWRSVSRDMASDADPAGYMPLREAIAAYVSSARAVRCDAGQVMIVSGSQQGLDLAARMLIDPGDRVWIEDPAYLGARAALQGAGARLIPVPVDDEGLSIARARSRSDARLVYVTPSHQFPLGVTMSLARRLTLLDWAARSGAWVLEDDCASEFRFSGRPIASLQGLDPAGRVIYIGTFSKVMFPALRLGYMILPPELVDAFVSARTVADRHPPTIEQAVLADFMAEGHFGRHVRRMRALYAERRQLMIDCARRCLDGLVELRPRDAGMHMAAWLPEGVDDAEASRKAAAHGVEAPPLSAYSLQNPRRGALILGFSQFTGREIRDGMRRLAIALRGDLKKH